MAAVRFANGSFPVLALPKSRLRGYQGELSGFEAADEHVLGVQVDCYPVAVGLAAEM
jgi:hypothetical protein